MSKRQGLSSKRVSSLIFASVSVLMSALVLALVLPAALSARAAERPSAQSATIAATAAVTTEASTEASTRFDRWFVMTMDGRQIGYAHEKITARGDRLISTNHTHMQIRRGLIPLTIDQKSRFVETSAGKPVEAVSMTDMGIAAITRTMRFASDGITLTVQQGTRVQTQKLPPIRGHWLTPVAELHLLKKRIAAGVMHFSYRTVDPSMGSRPVTKTMTCLGRQNVKVFGRIVSAYAWDVTVSSMPGTTLRSYTDAQGHDVRSSAQLMPGLSMTIAWADRQLAQAKINPPEMMARLLIHPDKPIAHPRHLRQAVFQLCLRRGAVRARVSLPQTGYQRVVWGNRRTARVVVDLDHPVSPGADLPTRADIGASTMINSRDPKIIALTHQALGKAAAHLSNRQKARRLRRFVSNYITRTNLAVGLASASEVARTREGDCTEHAVLLAAMLRVAGIPSRTVTGLLYVRHFLGKKDVFGYHMWTQAWLSGVGTGPGAAGGRWVDLDAILAAHGPGFDATHITLGVSSMSNRNMGNDLVAMVPVLGRLAVKVIQTRQPSPPHHHQPYQPPQLHQPTATALTSEYDYGQPPTPRPGRNPTRHNSPTMHPKKLPDIPSPPAPNRSSPLLPLPAPPAPPGRGPRVAPGITTRGPAPRGSHYEMVSPDPVTTG